MNLIDEALCLLRPMFWPDLWRQFRQRLHVFLSGSQVVASREEAARRAGEAWCADLAGVGGKALDRREVGNALMDFEQNFRLKW